MKKYIPIVACLVAGTAFANAADTVIFDFDATDLTTTGLTSVTLTDELSQFKATIEVASGYTLVGGDWGTAGSGAEYDYIAASSKVQAATLTLTFSGLEAGKEYDISLVTGVPFEGAGSWNSMNTSNEYDSTDLALGTQNVQVRSITTYNVKGVLADLEGNIEFSIGKSSGAHTASFNYATITPIPEPSTFGLLAGLGALALVGARRRRR